MLKKKPASTAAISGRSEVSNIQEDAILEIDSQDSLLLELDELNTEQNSINRVDETESQSWETEQTPGTSYSSTPTASTSSSKLRKERNTKRKRTDDLEEPVKHLVDTCSTIGSNLNMLIRQSALDLSEQNQEDYLFAASLAQSLSKVKNEKKKLIVKSKILVLVAEELDN